MKNQSKKILTFFLILTIFAFLPNFSKAKAIKKASIVPSKAKIQASKKIDLKFVVKSKGKVKKGALWYVNGLLGGNDAVGTITSKKGGRKAVYEAPDLPPNPSTVIIRAESKEDSSKTATAKIIIKDKKIKKKSAKIKGVAATGLPIAGAPVEVINSIGEIVGNDTTENDGSYLVKIKKKKYEPPFLVKVTPEGEKPLYSIASGDSKIANVTPLTDKAVESFIVKNGGSVSDDDYSDDIKKIKETVADFDGEFEKAKDALEKALGIDTLNIDFVKSKLDPEDPENDYEKILETIKDSIEASGKNDIDDLIKVDDDFIDVNNDIILLYKDKGILSDDKIPEDFSEDELPKIEGVITNPLTVTDTTTITGTVIVTNTITVNDIDIIVSDTAKIVIKDANGNKTDGSFSDLSAGKFVEVKYYIDGDLFYATEIEVKNKKKSENEDDLNGLITQKNEIAKSIVVDGKAIFINNDTEIRVNDSIASFSDLAIGQKVEVDVLLTDNKLVATKIKVESQESEDEKDAEEVKGIIDKIIKSNNEIVVDGIVIAITPDTKIEINDTLGSFSDLSAGQFVNMKTVFINGKLSALKVEVKNEEEGNNNNGGNDGNENDNGDGNDNNL
ncbi:MAG: hypothetical protein D6734_01890 [Candidatus Schekmanbacteria bacterium]|nr:MAG: hypothetical protein D6734_01890 [Candidatus Schekmanbacteria bacterium]